MTVSLSDKYDLTKNQIYVSGTQAVIRMLLMQKARDEAAGLKTSGFISGYRGSPLGGLDLQIGRAGNALSDNDIHFEAGINEELAATAIWGTQQVGFYDAARTDGVFSLWYGKGPGVDRAGVKAAFWRLWVMTIMRNHRLTLMQRNTSSLIQ